MGRVTWLVVGLMLVFAGCGDTGRTAGLVEAPALVQRLLPSVVKVVASDGSGSGVFIRDDVILTAGHMLDCPNDLAVVTVAGVRDPVISGIRCRDGNDLAILRVKTDRIEPALPLKPGMLAAAVIHIGAPMGMFPTVTAGTVSCLNVTRPDMDLAGMLQTDTFSCPGSSGGPLFDTRGNIVGIVVRGVMPGIGFCVPAGAIQKFLRDVGVK